jgi:phosphatidylglycerophosphate synthase
MGKFLSKAGSLMSNRPVKPTIKAIREITQPLSVTGRSNAEHWIADLYLRKISPYVTRLLLRTSITANGVTYLMIATGVAISGALLIPGWLGLSLALFLSQLQMLWDCVDGEIARWRQTQSAKGVFLDRIGHYLTEGLIPIALGLRVIGWPENQNLDYQTLFYATLISTLIILNKGFNDSVHVARAFAGLPKVEDSQEANQAKSSLLRYLKLPFKIFPIQRLFHSIEMTLIIFIFAGSEQIILIGLPLILIVTVGHLTSILASRKLDRGFAK